jgi:hypothetical protein
MDHTVTLADIEGLCWRLSGWRVEQRDVDRLLASVRAYAAAPGTEPCPCTVRTYLAPTEPVSALTGPARDTPAPFTVAPRLAASQAPAEPARCAEPVKDAEADPDLPRGAIRAPRPMRRAGMGPGRTCRQCKERWALEEYARDIKGVSGRKTVCRACENVRNRERRKEQRARQRAEREARRAA